MYLRKMYLWKCTSPEAFRDTEWRKDNSREVRSLRKELIYYVKAADTITEALFLKQASSNIRAR